MREYNIKKEKIRNKINEAIQRIRFSLLLFLVSLFVPKAVFSQYRQLVATSVTPYYIPHIVIILTFLYLLSLYLKKKQIISSFTHQAIWEVGLTVSFIVLALNSIQYLLVLKFGLFWTFGLNLSRIHIESGIVMLVLTFFHILSHLSYYKSVYRVALKKLTLKRLREKRKQ